MGGLYTPCRLALIGILMPFLALPSRAAPEHISPQSAVRRAAPRLLPTPAAQRLAPATRPGSAPAPSAPAATRWNLRVTATGEAAIMGDDVAAARQQARDSAGREAMTQVVAGLLGEESRAEDSARVAGVVERWHETAAATRWLSEGAEGESYRSTGEFEVQRASVARLLQDAGLFPECRVMVAVAEEYIGRPVPNSASRQEIIRSLTAAGFRILAPGAAQAGGAAAVEEAVKAGVDLLVLGRAEGMPCSSGAPGLASVRARVDVRVVLPDTGEVGSAHTQVGAGADVAEGAAARMALSRAARQVAQRLLQDILVLRARPTRRVRIEVTGLTPHAHAAGLTRAVGAIPGVARAVLVAYDVRRVLLDADVSICRLPGFAAAIESNEGMKPFALTIAGESRYRIRATAAPAPAPEGG